MTSEVATALGNVQGDNARLAVLIDKLTLYANRLEAKFAAEVAVLAKRVEQLERPAPVKCDDDLDALIREMQGRGDWVQLHDESVTLDGRFRIEDLQVIIRRMEQKP